MCFHFFFFTNIIDFIILKQKTDINNIDNYQYIITTYKIKFNLYHILLFKKLYFPQNLGHSDEWPLQ